MANTSADGGPDPRPGFDPVGGSVLDAGPRLPARGLDPDQSATAPPVPASGAVLWDTPRMPAGDAAPRVLGRSRILEEPEPVPLRRVAWAKWCFLGAAVVSPLISLYSVATASDTSTRDHFVPYQAAALGLVLLAVIVWSWVSVDNARRLLANSRFVAHVSPWRATFWWLAPGVVGVPVLLGFLWLGRTVIEPAMASSGDGDVVVGWVAVQLVLWTRPYLYLASVASRIRADATAMRRWLWLPVVAWFGALFAIAMLRFVGVGRGDVTLVVFGGIVLGLSLLPYATWCWTGWNALSSMDLLSEGAAAGQRRRYDEFRRVEHRASETDAAFDPTVDWR